MPPRKMDDGSDGESNGKRSRAEKGSEDYLKRRERNNIAVRKSRERSRQKAKEAKERMSELQNENIRLEQKVQILSKELSVLKDLFLAHAGSGVSNEISPQGSEIKTEVKPITSQAKNIDHQYSIITLPERLQ